MAPKRLRSAGERESIATAALVVCRQGKTDAASSTPSEHSDTEVKIDTSIPMRSRPRLAAVHCPATTETQSSVQRRKISTKKTAGTAVSKPSRLLTLPSELRVKIFDYALPQVDGAERPSCRNRSALLYVNKQICKEALDKLYNSKERYCITKVTYEGIDLLGVRFRPRPNCAEERIAFFDYNGKHKQFLTKFAYHELQVDVSDSVREYGKFLRLTENVQRVVYALQPASGSQSSMKSLKIKLVFRAFESPPIPALTDTGNDPMVAFAAFRTVYNIIALGRLAVKKTSETFVLDYGVGSFTIASGSTDIGDVSQQGLQTPEPHRQRLIQAISAEWDLWLKKPLIPLRPLLAKTCEARWSQYQRIYRLSTWIHSRVFARQPRNEHHQWDWVPLFRLNCSDDLDRTIMSARLAYEGGDIGTLEPNENVLWKLHDQYQAILADSEKFGIRTRSGLNLGTAKAADRAGQLKWPLIRGPPPLPITAQVSHDGIYHWGIVNGQQVYQRSLPITAPLWRANGWKNEGEIVVQ